MVVVKAVLIGFEHASKLRIIFHKSSIICMNLDMDEAKQLSTLMNCRGGTFPFIYLGLPPNDRKQPRQYLLSLIEKDQL